MGTVIKFDTIKERAVEAFGYRIWESGLEYPLFLDSILPAINSGVHPRELSRQWADEAVNIIRKWDVRCVRHLIECFPGCVPQRCIGQCISAYVGDAGEWYVEFT